MNLRRVSTSCFMHELQPGLQSMLCALQYVLKAALLQSNARECLRSVVCDCDVFARLSCKGLELMAWA